MKASSIKKLIRIYLKLTRKLTRDLKLPSNKTRNYFDLSMIEFSKLINSFEYRMDPLKGAIDYIAHPDSFFDKSKKQGRDCDDWSRMWTLWGLYHGYRAYEYVVCDPSSLKTAFNTMHCITVLERKDKFYLMNYKYYGPFSTIEAALNKLKTWPSYSQNLLIVQDRELTLA